MTLKIEHNIPLPTNGFGGGRPMSEETYIALKMKPGDSILCPTERIYMRIVNTFRRRKIVFTSRKVEGGYRVWRVDGRTLPKASNA
jgi:hypothetical protein